MDFEYTEDQIAIRDLAKQIFEDRFSDEVLAKFASSEDWYDLDTWAELAKTSLLGAALPVAYGGAGMGVEEIALILEQAGRRIAPLPLIPTLVLGAMPIAEFGTETQCEENLPGVAKGERFLTAALVEDGRRDPVRCRTTAVADGADFLLNGQKTCVPGAARAARILVPAKTGDDTVSVFLVDPAAPGVTLLPQAVTNGEPHSLLELENVRVGGDEILGDPGGGKKILRWLEARAMVAACALQVGIADAALARTAEYQATRIQFGVPIGSFQGPQLRIADAFIDVRAMRSTLDQAVWRLAIGRDAEKAIAVAKWWACRGGHRVAHSCQHLHGGMGADVEYPIHRWFLWAKQTEVFLGGAAVHQARLGELLVAQTAA